MVLIFQKLQENQTSIFNSISNMTAIEPKQINIHITQIVIEKQGHT